MSSLVTGFAKNAFNTKAGKKGGRGLTVKFDGSVGSLYPSEESLFRKIINSKGLPAKAKLVTC